MHCRNHLVDANGSLEVRDILELLCVDDTSAEVSSNSVTNTRGRTGWLKSKLLILSEYVNKTAKTRGT